MAGSEQGAGQNWWSGGLMSMWEPVRRSFRCECSLSHYTHPQLTGKKLVFMTKWSLVENLCSFFCSVSLSNSQTPTPERMRTLVWTWMSLFICRNWMRWEVQYWLERHKQWLHMFSHAEALISSSCVIIFLLCVCVCFRSVLLESRYWMWTAVIFRRLMLISTVSWSVIHRWEWWA